MTRWIPIVTIASLVGFGCGGPPPEELPEDAGVVLLEDGGVDIIQGRALVSFECSPVYPSISVGETKLVKVVATFDDGQSVDVSGEAQWRVAPAGIVEVDVLSAQADTVRVIGLKPGTAEVTAVFGNRSSTACLFQVRELLDAGGDAGTEEDAGYDAGMDVDGGMDLDAGFDAGVPEEARAVWVTRFAYSNADQVRGIIHRAADAGFNTVYFQIRGNGDAYYDSNLVPWAKKLTGTLGKDPGWDPLQVAIDTAHAQDLKLHAYWNVFSAWTARAGCTGTGCHCVPQQGLTDSCELPEPSFAGSPDHVLRAHPEWIAVDSTGKSVDGEYLYFSPGNPDVRAHLLAVADELLTNYDVDGLHLDRVRYAGTGYSHDAVSESVFDALPNPKPTWADWQRKNVTDTVAALYQTMKQRRPNAVLSASVWGIYKPLSGCSTSQGYGNYYQDSLKWMQQGVIDAIVPMIYWDIGTGCTDWADLLDTFMAGANGRHVIAGMHGLDDSAQGDKPQLSKMKARIEYARSVGAAGTSIFASSYLEPKTTGTPTWGEQWTQFHGATGPYQEPAFYPAMPWR